MKKFVLVAMSSVVMTSVAYAGMAPRYEKFEKYYKSCMLKAKGNTKKVAALKKAKADVDRGFKTMKRRQFYTLVSNKTAEVGRSC